MGFDFINTEIDGLLHIKPQKFDDERGYFLETFKKSAFLTAGITDEFVQDNHSCSCKGVLRGIHYQADEMAQGKLVHVVIGSVWDVVVDLRVGSPTFGKWLGFDLRPNESMLYIPPGCGHGFMTLQDNTHFTYKCTKEYAPQCERGIRWDDPTLNISWPSGEKIISPKDEQLPLMSETYR